MKKIILSAISIMILLFNVNPVDADNSASKTTNQSATITGSSLSISEISMIDQYVIVQNNSYVLTVPEETAIDSGVLHTAYSML